MLSRLAALFRRHVQLATVPQARQIERTLLLQAQQMVEHRRQIAYMHGSVLTSIKDAEFSVFSQWGEDGILDWLVSNIPGIPHVAVEFGCSDYQEATTRLLVQLRNWKAVLVDASVESCAAICSSPLMWQYDLTVLQRTLTPSMLAAFCNTHIPKEIGVLSLDVDGMDYWLLTALPVKPVVLVCEYNALFGNTDPITVPLTDNFDRRTAHWTHLYFGASLPAIATAAQRQGYTWIGTESHGCNAFFVRHDYAQRILDKLDQIIPHEAQFREGRDVNGQLAYSRERRPIAHLPVWNVQTNQTVRVQEADCRW